MLFSILRQKIAHIYQIYVQKKTRKYIMKCSIYSRICVLIDLLYRFQEDIKTEIDLQLPMSRKQSRKKKQRTKNTSM